MSAPEDGAEMAQVPSVYPAVDAEADAPCEAGAAAPGKGGEGAGADAAADADAVAAPGAWILPTIVFSQFAGTSLWFAGNAVMGDLQDELDIASAAEGYMTSSVQFGFILGTLAFSLVALADRVSPRIVFLACSLGGAAANLGTLLAPEGLALLLVFRGITGVFLAGIYPVGMTIAASWFDKRTLGKAIGFLVGALVLGTGFPHLLNATSDDLDLDWRAVIVAVSILACIGGFLMFALVPDGPLRVPNPNNRLDPSVVFVMFQEPSFRQSAFAYWGHMLELYAWWAFVPTYLDAFKDEHPRTDFGTSMMSFWIIALGSVSCGLGGLLSQRIGSAKVALGALVVSGTCCLLSPVFFDAGEGAFLLLMFVWGLAVIADSPQLSALTARSAPRQLVGSALTIATCIGFALTIGAIEFTNWFSGQVEARFTLMPLAVGPAIGIAAVLPLAVGSK